MRFLNEMFAKLVTSIAVPRLNRLFCAKAANFVNTAVFGSSGDNCAVKSARCNRDGDQGYGNCCFRKMRRALTVQIEAASRFRLGSRNSG